MQRRPYVGNPHVRFDEGTGVPARSGWSALLNNTHRYFYIFMVAVLAAVFVDMSPCLAQTAQSCSRRVASSCSCRCIKTWDYYPRPELNPPDDIASLPDIEQQRFIKIFRLVPESVKVKSSQNYRERIVFMRSPQYVTITNKLAVKLSRSGRMLSQDPAISAGDVIKMCHDTIVYGRSLVMGKMDDMSFVDLAQQYRFKNAGREVEKVEDKRNFTRKTGGTYPMDDPECRDFAVLAKTVNPAKWQSFLDRNVALVARNSVGAAPDVSKKQMYDMYTEQTSRKLPEDLSSLPNRVRLKIGKMYDLLPVQVVAVSEREYKQRVSYASSPQYAKVKEDLATKLSKDTRRMSADPAVTVADVLKLSDEVIRFGRPLVAGDMRNVSLQMLASGHGYPNVEKFVRLVEDSQYMRRGKPMKWPSTQPEFCDFEQLAKAMYKDRWQLFQTRLQTPGRK